MEGAARSACQQELSRRPNSLSSVRIKTLAFFNCAGSRICRAALGVSLAFYAAAALRRCGFPLDLQLQFFGFIDRGS
jgi:hypothetical protein